MLDNQTYAIVLQGLKVLFLGTLPVIIGLAVVGTITAALQSAMSIQDAATTYAIKLLALMGILYFFLPGFLASVVTLAELAYR
jgi:type III secretory pathway component EscS